MKQSPPWLEQFQRRFSEVLRTPLDASRGTLMARLPECWKTLDVQPRSHRSAAEGLADYQRQYWFRLLTILQKDFPLTARLMGLWTFNQWAQAYLLEVPPRAYDLAEIRLQFARFLEAQDVSRMIVQAARLDEARADVMMTPAFKAWTGLTEDSQPDRMRLRAAPHWRFFREDWGLVMLNDKLRVPEVHAQTQTWLILKDAEGIMYHALHPVQARLYELLAERTIMDAVVVLEAEYSGHYGAELCRLVQNWMRISVLWGLWESEEKAAKLS